MDGLRWLLLAAGLIVIVGIYLVGRHSGKKDSSVQKKLEPTPVHSDEPLVVIDDDLEDVELEPMFVEEPKTEPKPRSSEQKIVTMRLVARNGGAFKGDELILSLRGIGMRHGKFGIFHRIDGDDDDATIFSAASLVEPGSFDIPNIKEQTIPGISLFLVLPGPIDGAEAFDMMMESARAVMQALDGELLDETGSTLSIQRERYLREEIIKFEHSIRVS